MKLHFTLLITHIMADTESEIGIKSLQNSRIFISPIWEFWKWKFCLMLRVECCAFRNIISHQISGTQYCGKQTARSVVKDCVSIALRLASFHLSDLSSTVVPKAALEKLVFWRFCRHCSPSFIITMRELLVSFMFMIMSISAFKSSSTSRTSLKSIKMALKLETIYIPIQLNPCDYVLHLRKIIPEEEIIRWYIAKIEDDRAVLEVVREVQ